MKYLTFNLIYLALTSSLVYSQTTVTITAGTNWKDATISHSTSSSTPGTTNYGTRIKLTALAWTGPGYTFNRDLIYFDVSAIPSSSVITSAVLYLYQDPTWSTSNNGIGVHSQLSSDNELYLEKITQSWDESTVTWSNQPTTTITDRVWVPQTSGYFQDDQIDITTLVQDMVSNPSSNFGIMMKMATEVNYCSRNYASEDYSNPSYHPKLVVTYSSSSPSLWTQSGNDLYYDLGFVGIGTSTPAEWLDVSGDIMFNNNALVVTQASQTSNVDHIWHDDATVGGAPGTWHFVSDGTYKGNGNTRLRGGHVYMAGSSQTSYFAGDMGIGTATPEAKVDIRGGDLMVYQRNLFLLKQNNGTNDGMGLGYIDGAKLNIFSDAEIHFQESDADVTKIWMDVNNGKMAIGGTSVPANYELAVFGKVITEEVQVKSSPWPDYVFSKDYQLTSLEELEAFIKLYKHLPGVPTSEEVASNGLSLSQINTLLVEKIEELTLYLIELKARNKEQDELISQLQNYLSNGK